MPFPVQSAVIPEALRGGDVLAKSPTGSGKTLAFGIPIVERLDPPLRGAARARPRADARARRQVTEAIEEIGRRSRPPRRRGLRRRAAAQAGAGRPHGADPRRHARPSPGSRRSPARSRSTTSPCSCSTRPTACSTWASSRRSTGSSRGCRRPADDVLLRDARRRGRRAGAALHALPGALRERPARGAPLGEVDHQFVPVTAENKVQTLIDLLPEDGARARLRPDEGRRRPARREAPPPRRRRGRDPRRQGPGAARAGARELRLGQGAHARRNRRRRARPRRRGHHARDQLRPARGVGRLHASRRPHRPGRTRGTGITLVLPEQQADVSRVARLQGHTESFEESGMTMARPRLVYTSRRGRGSKW